MRQSGSSPDWQCGLFSRGSQNQIRPGRVSAAAAGGRSPLRRPSRPQVSVSTVATTADGATRRNGLLPQHQALISGSAISPEVAATRGYWSATTKAELRRLGFADYQCHVPGLVVPVYGVRGELATYQIRPDHPRIGSNGKPIKYETPTRTQMVLDVPLLVRHDMGNPAVPLFITEGVRKADAAVSAGLCCIALLGVWNWRGTNEFGGKTVLPDWEHIALNGRQVYIVFDSDVMLNPQVHGALARLKAFLEVRGAR
jgi:hypothetical protein